VGRRNGNLRRALGEMRSSLPGRHQHTNLPKPEDPSDPGYDSIQTGLADPSDLTNWRDRALGVFFWLAWFGIGVYTWWFTDARLSDYVIATILWLAIFAFAIVGVPLVKIAARNRNRT